MNPNDLSSEQGIQEHEYEFPYHYVPEIGPFSETRSLWWGYEYASYIEYFTNYITEKAPATLIDVGCGDGRLLYELSKSSSITLYGTDFSAKALSFARAFCPASVTLDSTFPSDVAFDAFTAIEVFEHIPPADADTFLATISSRLSSNAWGIVTVPTTNIPVNPKHYRHFTAETLTAALEPHFKVREIRFLNATTLSAKIIQRLLANRFFMLNWQPAVAFLYRWYVSSSLIARPENASRLMAMVERH